MRQGANYKIIVLYRDGSRIVFDFRGLLRAVEAQMRQIYSETEEPIERIYSVSARKLRLYYRNHVDTLLAAVRCGWERSAYVT